MADLTFRRSVNDRLCASPLIRGGARLGGRGGRLENFVGEITKYVVSKADCRVIVTAPAARDFPRERSAASDQAGASIV